MRTEFEGHLFEEQEHSILKCYNVKKFSFYFDRQN